MNIASVSCLVDINDRAEGNLSITLGCIAIVQLISMIEDLFYVCTMMMMMMMRCYTNCDFGERIDG